MARPVKHPIGVAWPQRVFAPNGANGEQRPYVHIRWKQQDGRRKSRYVAPLPISPPDMLAALLERIQPEDDLELLRSLQAMDKSWAYLSTALRGPDDG